MTAATPERHLHVLCEEPGDVTRWHVVVESVATLVEASAVVHAGPCGPQQARDQAILERAASLAGPVLVLPSASSAGTAPAATRRVLAPIDRTPAEHRVLAPLLRRAESMGLELEEIHVLAGPARPPMWEGPGHHAEAWFDQLRRHHQVGDATVAVRSGEPAAAIRAAAPRSDLLLVCWNGDAARGRALVLRSLLRHARQPLLLVCLRPAAGGGPEAGAGPAGQPDRHGPEEAGTATRGEDPT